MDSYFDFDNMGSQNFFFSGMVFHSLRFDQYESKDVTQEYICVLRSTITHSVKVHSASKKHYFWILTSSSLHNLHLVRISFAFVYLVKFVFNHFTILKTISVVKCSIVLVCTNGSFTFFYLIQIMNLIDSIFFHKHQYMQERRVPYKIAGYFYHVDKVFSFPWSKSDHIMQH
jgi:hypothetical protein